VSVHSAILDAFVSLISDLELTLGDTPVSVGAARKIDEVRDGLDAAPLIQVACHRMGGQSRRWDTGVDGRTRKQVSYLVSISIELAGNRDPTANLATVTDWRQAIFRALAEPSQLSGFDFGSAQVYDLEHEPEGAFDSAAAAENWDSSPLTIRVIMIEPSTGA
jgi:hypothetical protein